MEDYEIDNGWRGMDELLDSILRFIEKRVDISGGGGVGGGVGGGGAPLEDIGGGGYCEDRFFRDGAFPELGAIRAELRRHVAGLQALVDLMNREIAATTTSTTATATSTSSTTSKTFVRIHKTEKSGISLLITKTRAKWLAAILKERATLEWPGSGGAVATSSFSLRASPGNESMMFLDGDWVRGADVRILAVQERAAKLSRDLYRGFVATMEAEWFSAMECFADYVGRLDVLINRAHVATNNHYSCPVLISGGDGDSKGAVKAVGMRHPLIETILKQEVYVPNDLELAGTGALLFGINSSGKTSLLRSLGICVILAQSGNFVPCDTFEYAPYRAIYSRILGNDDLFRGLSSFAVEMSELKVILRMADAYSLVLADEISKGSEMESAMSITTATIQHLAHKGASFLITSHLHEIVDFEEIRGLVSAGSLHLCHLSVAYDAENDALIYERRLKDGSGESFYGLLVCRSLHLPQSFIDAAYAVRAKSVAKRGLGAPTSHYNAAISAAVREVLRQ
jgi:DNA mismatch repair protein MutS